jgi:hypothetical protein
MRKGLLLLDSISWFLLMFAVSANAQTTALNEWTWVGGSHSIPQLGNYGTLGVAAAGTCPVVESPRPHGSIRMEISGCSVDWATTPLRGLSF